MGKTDFMITSLSDLRARRTRAFTLVEVLIAASIGSIVLAGVLASFLMLVRSGVRVSNYSTMEAQTRRAFEQLGIDSRMANKIVSRFDGSAITSFTLTIPSHDLGTQREVTYGFDTTSDPTNKKFFLVPGNNPAGTVGRLDLVTNVTNLKFLRYDTSSTLIPSSTTSDDTVKHIQVSISVSRSASGVAAATQVIRSSAFTMRNISL
jgi:prepilin-type N-terminal cleavage/methylation domain-containing protein